MSEDRAAAEPEHVAVYRRVRSVFGNAQDRSPDARRRKRTAREETSSPFGSGRDPHELGEVIGAFTSTMGWESPLAQSSLIAAWASIVGEQTADHSVPIGVEDGVLSVRCDSTAWAQQLRLMRNQVLASIAREYPAARIESVRFMGPDTPSWKRGPRAVPGRGPRDTYG